jgi:hypothetical protein
MHREFLPILCAFLLAAPAAQASVAFDSILAHEALWTLDPDGFEKATPGMPFRWTSVQRDSARAAAPQGMTLFGRPVVEVIARFDAGKLGVMTANFYARGDAGDLSEPQFRTLLADTMDAISRATGLKATARGRDASSAVKADGFVWQTAKSQYLLEYSFTREVKSRGIPFRAEFVRLEVRPVEKRSTLLTSATPTRPRFNPADHIKREANGDVWLHDVPMVDQGQKGYCVVATTERVVRYYGGEVDSNELAQMGNSDAEGGTSLTAMTAALKKVAARLRIKVREHEKLEIKAILAMVRDYNRAAKAAGEPQIPDPGNFIDVGAIYGAMKGEVLKEARTRNKADMNRFARDVQRYVDAGVPVLWSVHLGLVPEPHVPQSGGGHMRLIIGYNLKTQEILYSDSWGAGHELKRMKIDDAWTITTQVLTIEPLT